MCGRLKNRWEFESFSSRCLLIFNSFFTATFPWNADLKVDISISFAERNFIDLKKYIFIIARCFLGLVSVDFSKTGYAVKFSTNWRRLKGSLFLIQFVLDQIVFLLCSWNFARFRFWLVRGWVTESTFKSACLTLYPSALGRIFNKETIQSRSRKKWRTTLC